MDLESFSHLPDIKNSHLDKYQSAFYFEEADIILDEIKVPRMPDRGVPKRLTHLYISGINREKREIVVGNCLLQNGTNEIHKPYAILLEDILSYIPNPVIPLK